MMKFVGRLLTLRSVARFTQKVEQESLDFVGNPNASVMKDFLDYQGEVDNFKLSNQMKKEEKFQSGPSPRELNIKADLQSLLGQNFERYSNTLYRIDLVGKGDASYHIPSSQYHAQYAWSSKVYRSEEDLRAMRQLESRSGPVTSKYPQSAAYPLESLKSIYKATEFCGALTDQQLIMFNIPLDVNEEAVGAYLHSRGIKASLVHIHQCKLSLNSHATVTISGSVVEAVAQLTAQRFNGCLLDVRSSVDALNENMWDRTLVLMNLDPTLQLQEIIHHASEFGRVTNFLVPKMLLNPDLLLEEELIESLERQNLQDPVRLVVYDLESNKVVRRFWPSESEFMAFNKNTQAYNDMESSLLKFQEAQLDKEMQQRLFFLRSGAEQQCVRVPMHLKEEYKKLWMPDTKDKDGSAQLTLFQKQLRHLYTKQYVNLGYSLITYSSKSMAQRALYNINLPSSKDLALLAPHQINQPRFWPDLTAPHTESQRYGHKFRIENLYLGRQNKTMQAIKAWDGMELYEVDNMYIQHQMERLRKEQSNTIENVRQKINEESEPKDKEGEQNLDRKEQLRQKIMRQLAEPQTSQQFDDAVMKRNFSAHEDLFEDTLAPLLSLKPGRNFNINALESDYAAQIERLIEKQNHIQGKQHRYVDDLITKNQQEHIEAARELRLNNETTIEGDEIDQQLQDRLIDRYQKLQKQVDGALEPFDSFITAATKAGLDQSRAASVVRKVKTRVFEAERKNRKEGEGTPLTEEGGDEAQQLNDTPKSNFSTHNKKQDDFQLERHGQLKREQFLKHLKRLMFGSLSIAEREALFANDDEISMDSLKHNQLHAQDHLGNAYLGKAEVEYIKEFDLPEEETARMLIREQQFNRQYLVALVPQEMIKQLRDEGREHLSDSLLQFYRDGLPTESFQLESEVDGEALKNQLNQFVAGSGEKYHYEQDGMTKQKYIVKSEKPYFKYDLIGVAGVNEVELSETIVKLLQEHYQMSRDRAQQMVQTSLSTGEIAKPIVELFDKLYIIIVSSQPINVEKMCREQNITKRVLDVHLNNNIFSERELYYREVQEQYKIEEMKLKAQTLNPDNIVKESDEKWRIKDKAGQFVVPKYRKV